MSLLEVVLDFLPRLAVGLRSNVAIATAALALGMVAGLAMAWTQQSGTGLMHRLLASTVRGGVSLLRASPTFVLIFFFLNVLPGPWRIMGFEFKITPWWSCAIALACYATAYVYDNTLEAVGQWRRTRQIEALALLLPAVVRVFFVMVLSSGFGAAVGVPEAVSVTISTMERLPDISHRLLVLGSMMLVMTAAFQCIYAATRLFKQRLVRKVDMTPPMA